MSLLRYRWNGSELIDVTGAPEIPLYVADSFLLADGQIVAWEKHVARFSQSAQAQGLVRPVDDFLQAVTSALPKEGQYFPRIDLTERGELELRLRPAPSLRHTLSVITATHDPRMEPAIKGPDIPALGEIQQWASSLGADDAVILDSNGHIVDGTTTCLVWSRGDDFFTPPQSALRVASTTVSVFQDMTEDSGIRWHESSASPAELERHSLYALNALHGIQAVTTWIDGPHLEPDTRVDSWRSAYQQRARPVRRP